MPALQNTLYRVFFPTPSKCALIFPTFFSAYHMLHAAWAAHSTLTVFSPLFWFPISVCPSLLEVTQATQGLCSRPRRLPEAHRDEGRPLCEEMIFSVLRRTLQIISSNLSNGSEMLLPLSCNGDRWLAGQTGASQTPVEGANKPPCAHTHTNTCIKRHSTGGPCDCR